jgi:two-component system phosphate regulon sensor histidine kinase PhoR
MQQEDAGELLQRLAAAQALLANIPDPLIVVGADGLVREANAAARDLLPTLRIARPLSYGLRTPEILTALSSLSPGETIHVEHRSGPPAQRLFDVQVTALPATGGVQRPDIMLLFRDFTAARRLEQMRADFVANVSHEMRTPLASLVGFIETLQGPARDDAQARDRFLAIMREQAWRMTRLVDNLLSLSRTELREHLPPDTPVEIRALVTQMVEMLSPRARDRQVEIKVQMPTDPVSVMGDRDELLRLVENLVENAVKYGGSGGRVDVQLGTRSDRAELSVRDYGPGIAPEHLPRLTERFYRIDVAESRDKGGTGLGLAIVKHIVNRHRGELSIESEPGQGALFRVSLPVHGGR